MSNHPSYIRQLYKILEKEELESMYEDYIVHLIGMTGLNALLEERLLETCGVINGKQSYVLWKPEHKGE